MPLALGFVGLLLIGYNVTGLDITAVVVATLLLTALWLASAVLAFREYGVNLRGVLAKRAWDPVALRIDDEASHAAVNQLLDSSDPHDVHAALDALVDTGRDVTGARTRAAGTIQSRHAESWVSRSPSTTELLRVPAVTVPGAGHARRPRSGRGAPRGRIAGPARHGRPSERRVVRRGWPPSRRRTRSRDRPGAAGRRRASRTGSSCPISWAWRRRGRASGEVLDALGANCDHLAPRVQGLLADQSVPRQTRERVVHFLGMAVTPAARDLLVAHLDDGDPAIVEAAGLCLVAVGHSETPERLELGPRLVVVAERVEPMPVDPAPAR